MILESIHETPHLIGCLFIEANRIGEFPITSNHMCILKRSADLHFFLDFLTLGQKIVFPAIINLCRSRSFLFHTISKSFPLTLINITKIFHSFFRNPIIIRIRIPRDYDIIE